MDSSSEETTEAHGPEYKPETTGDKLGVPEVDILSEDGTEGTEKFRGSEQGNRQEDPGLRDESAKSAKK